MIANLKQLARRLKAQTYTLYLVVRDPRTPWFAKLVAGAVVAYALSPIDLIPDFIPVLGYLDDLLLLPMGIWLAIRLVPPEVMQDCRIRAEASSGAVGDDNRKASPLNRQPAIASKPRGLTSRAARVRVRGKVADACARGLALFFGLFSLANAVGWLLNGPHHEDIWWIDLSALPRGLAVAFGVAAALLLVAWAVRPSASRARRLWTAAVCVALATAAVANVAAFYQVWRAGRIAPGMIFPASVLYAAVFAWLAYRISNTSRPRERSAFAGVAAVVLALAIAFPLVQMTFFGTTDYRRPADAAVVLGAKVTANGSLSTALEDRVRTGVDLYEEGLVGHLIMSGGVGASGVDEGVAMRRRAIELGVPDDAILVDHLGINTDATVAQTTHMFSDLGIRRVLVVSQFWHLPRIKLAYLKSGWNVSTVPAGTSTPIRQTPYLIAREIPAFWTYWVRSI